MGMITNVLIVGEVAMGHGPIGTVGPVEEPENPDTRLGARSKIRER